MAELGPASPGLAALFKRTAPPVVSEEEGDSLIGYLLAESSKLFQEQGPRPIREPIEIPPTVERIEAVAEVGLPRWAHELVEKATESERAELLEWLEEVIDRAVGGATGLGGPYG